MIKVLSIICCACLLVFTSSCSKFPGPNYYLTNGVNPNSYPETSELEDSTIEGVDADDNGVRDDIQRYIDSTYPHSDRIRAALRQYARAFQIFLLKSGDKERAYQNELKNGDALGCLFRLLPFDDADRIFLEFRAVYLNTEARTRAYLKADAKLGGRIFHTGTPPEEACYFDFKSMRN